MWLDELSLLLLVGEAPGTSRLWAPAGRWCRRAGPRARVSGAASAPQVAARRPADGDHAEIRAQFPAGESDRLLERFPYLLMLRWNQLGELAATGVEIGSHGVNHDVHHSWQPREERLRELVRFAARARVPAEPPLPGLRLSERRLRAPSRRKKPPAPDTRRPSRPVWRRSTQRRPATCCPASRRPTRSGGSSRSTGGRIP